jgi:hypothetical protein
MELALKGLELDHSLPLLRRCVCMFHVRSPLTEDVQGDVKERVV